MDTPKLEHTPAEQSHVRIMQAIAKDLSDLPMVLKGGTALLLCYGLDRFSEDLDFDAPKKFNVAGRVEKVLSRLTSEHAVRTVKDTETVQRLKIQYRTEDVSRLLKIETSFRNQPDTDSVVVHEGIKTYKVSELIAQKLRALEGRTKARDLYDVAFLHRQYPHEFTSQSRAVLSALVKDINALESRFQLAFEDDSILRAEQLPELLLQLQEAA